MRKSVAIGLSLAVGTLASAGAIASDTVGEKKSILQSAAAVGAQAMSAGEKRAARGAGPVLEIYEPGILKSVDLTSLTSDKALVAYLGLGGSALTEGAAQGAAYNTGHLIVGTPPL